MSLSLRESRRTCPSARTRAPARAPSHFHSHP
jgi:hypothetical protein